MKKILLALSLFLAACSTAALDDRGAKVMVVDGISPSDLLVYEHVADLKAYGMRSIDDCRNDLRNKAAEVGATVIRITSTEPAICAEELATTASKSRFNAYADAFKPKQK